MSELVYREPDQPLDLKEWTQSLVIPLPEKDNFKQCQNYHTTNLISHPSQIMFRVTFNLLKTKADEVQAKEQAGFKAGRSTVGEIFKRAIIEKRLRRNLFHNFADFKKASERV